MYYWTDARQHGIYLLSSIGVRLFTKAGGRFFVSISSSEKDLDEVSNN